MVITDTAISEITLEHVEFAEIDVNRLLSTEYETAHIDFAILMVRASYNRYLREIARVDDGEITYQLKYRALLYAKVDAQAWLLEHGKELIDRTIAYLVAEANEVGWFREDYFSWDSINDLLAHIIDAQESGTTNAWYWNQFATKIIPAAKAAGVSPGQLLSASAQARKLHMLVTAYNQIENKMKENLITPEEAAEDLSWMINMTAAKKVTALTMKEELDRWQGKVVQRPEPIDGYLAVLPDDQLVFMIPISNNVEQAMVEQGLRNKVNISMVGADFAIQQLTKMLRLEKLNDRSEIQ